MDSFDLNFDLLISIFVSNVTDYKVYSIRFKWYLMQHLVSLYEPPNNNEKKNKEFFLFLYELLTTMNRANAHTLNEYFSNTYKCDYIKYTFYKFKSFFLYLSNNRIYITHTNIIQTKPKNLFVQIKMTI